MSTVESASNDQSGYHTRQPHLVRTLVFAGSRAPAVRWVESLLLAGLSLAGWYQLHPAGQEMSDVAGFGAALTGPLLIALRYGLSQGALCGGLVIAGMLALESLLGVPVTFPELAILLLAVVVSGEFRDHWHSLNRVHIARHDAMWQKLNRFTGHYHLLKASHDQLEQLHAGKTTSLHSAVLSLQRIAALNHDHRLETLAQPFLDLFAQIVGLYEGGIYAVCDGKIQSRVFASIGAGHQLKADDAMVCRMLEDGRLLSPVDSLHSAQARSRYQLCVPLADANGCLQAVLIAERVRFVSLTGANLDLLALVARHAADLLNTEIALPALLPNQREVFSLYLQRSLTQAEEGVTSHILLVIGRENVHETLLDNLSRMGSGGDVFWKTATHDGQPALALLMPSTAQSDAAQYRTRIEAACCNQEETAEVEIVGPCAISATSQELEQIRQLLGLVGHAAIQAADGATA